MKNEEKKLLGLFDRLAPEQQDTLLALAEFLAKRAPDAETAPAEPLVIPRPARESVTMALRRLVKTYPMLDRRKLMPEASRYMAQHALEGRDTLEVIAELELVFARHYQSMKDEG